MSTSGRAIDTGAPPPIDYNCTYCVKFFGWWICIKTTTPIPGADPAACQY